MPPAPAGVTVPDDPAWPAVGDPTAGDLVAAVAKALAGPAAKAVDPEVLGVKDPADVATSAAKAPGGAAADRTVHAVRVASIRASDVAAGVPSAATYGQQSCSCSPRNPCTATS